MNFANDSYMADSMEKDAAHTQDDYIKALMNISQAITSDLYLEDLLKLIVMVRPTSPVWPSALSGWSTKRKIHPRST